MKHTVPHSAFLLLLPFLAVAPEAPPTPGVWFSPNGQSINVLAGRGVVLRDFNGDRHLDAFFVNENSPDGEGYRMYLGDGRGRLTDSGQRLANPSGWAMRPAAGDVNGDGAPDVVTGNRVWINDGQGRFTARDDLITAGEAKLTLADLADLNGDGSPDLLASAQWRTLGVYLNDGHGHFRDTGQRLGSGIVGALALGDVDGNGSVDAVSAGWRMNPADPSPNRVWLNDGKGTLRDSGQVLDEGEHHVHGVALGDVNRDGRLDAVLAITTPGHSGKVYLNGGQGLFRDSGQILGHRWAHGVALGDLNGDGSLDAFLTCGEPQTGTPNEVWLNDGRGGFRDGGLRLGGAFSWHSALGDLNEDGRLDAVVANLRLADGSKAPPVFGGVPAEVWLNREPIDYLGQEPPGDEPRVFGKGTVSVEDKNTHALQFSPDGRMLIFSRYPDGTSFLMRRTDRGWSAAVETSFRGKEVSFDAARGRLFYYAGDSLYFVRYGERFSEPVRLPPPIDTAEVEYYPSVTAQGDLYFSRNSRWDQGRIQVAKLEGDGFGPPVDLGEPVNTGGASHAFVAPDESYMLFNSPRAGSFTKNDIWASFRQTAGTWGAPVNLGERINRDASAVLCPTVSPDGEYLFFTRLLENRTGLVYWVSSSVIEQARQRAAATHRP